MDELLKLREIISSTDREMAALFEKRMTAVKAVAEYKKEKELPIADYSREEQVISDGLSVIGNEDIREYYVPFIKSTMEISRNFQKELIEGESSVLGSTLTVERGAIKKASEIFRIKGRVLVVTDSGVPAEYAVCVASQFEKSDIFTFAQGENNKTHETCISLYRRLIELSFDRNDAIVAVGGGVVGDLAGFAAATYMRGIAFYNIPTTLLSQVDSSVGGKTGINFDSIKNTVGAFYQPKGVIIDPGLLESLPQRQFINGLAESIKMALCFDRELFELFEKENFIKDIDEIIKRSVAIKKYVVQQDEKEDGIRKKLNFGHTLGHAIESTCGEELFHGECVALGMLPMCSEEIRSRVRKVLRSVGLPTEYKIDHSLLEEKIRHDKKSQGEKILTVMCDEAGSCYFKKLSAEEIINLSKRV